MGSPRHAWCPTTVCHHVPKKNLSMFSANQMKHERKKKVSTQHIPLNTDWISDFLIRDPL